MKARVIRTGGLAGETRDLGEVDTDGVPPPSAAHVQRAAEALLAVGAEAAGDVGADLYEYRVELTTDDGTRTLHLKDLGDPEEPQNPALADLLRALRDLG